MKIIILLLVIMSASTPGCASSNPEQKMKQDRIERSPQWNGKVFQNTIPTSKPSVGDIASMAVDFIFRKPSGGASETPLPAEELILDDWRTDGKLQFAWLGHTTFLIKFEGKWILTDPMFSEKAGSFGWLSPARYSDLPIQPEQLPSIDVVLITHDHYDHLDKASIQSLILKTKHFIAPLAVGQYLEDWGVPREKISELDWWEEKKIDQLTITSAPAQHFSGRGLFDRDETLWTSYAINGESTNLYLSGDSGWHQGLYEIGERLGPFDVTFFEMGAYGKPKGWFDIHYTPEEAVKAHQAVKGKLLVPSHWGTFDLAMFQWHEPIERFLVAADLAGVEYITPKLGERINPGHGGGQTRWWRPFMKLDK